MTLSERLPALASAQNARELLTEEVKALYREETDPEQRALLYGDLREIARKNRFARTFDTAFGVFRREVEAQERAVIAQEQAARQRTDRLVSIQRVAAGLQELGITVRYNQLLREMEVQGLPFCYSKENAANILPIYLLDYLKASGCTGASLPAVDGCLSCIADRNRYNPIREYLEGGHWDETDRFPDIFRILGVTAPRYQTYIRKWFLQCVALGLNDEEHPIGADGALVLQGEQGLAKTSFFRLLAPQPRWFVEGASIDMRDKDSQIKALRGWIVELGELDSTLRKEQTSLKAFITLPEDRIRMPYAKNEIRSPRRTSFCGTVNPRDYLKDETGSRRFWTVPVASIDKETLFALPRAWIDQLWFQSYRLYRAAPDSFRLTDEEIRVLQTANQEFEQPLPYEVEILDKLDPQLPAEQWEWWRAADVAALLPGAPDARKVGRALAKLVKTLPDPPPTPTHKVKGNLEYLLPLRHVDALELHRGGSGWFARETLL